MSLRSVVGRALQLDTNAGIELHEAFELFGDEGAFRAER